MVRGTARDLRCRVKIRFARPRFRAFDTHAARFYSSRSRPNRSDRVCAVPTYEYECSKCGVFDHFQRISEKPLARCPTCKGKVKRLLGTGAGLLFKGSGFYITDYRSDSYKKAAKAESSSSSSASTTTATPPAAKDSKPKAAKAS